MNLFFFAKLILSALVIALASEVAKRDSFWGALLVALPLTSLLTMSFLYAETRDNELATRFARDILVLVPVSLVFFLPYLFESRTHFGFVPNTFIGVVLLALGVVALRRFLT